MRLHEYFYALHLSHSVIAEQIGQASGQQISRKLITAADSGEAIPLPKAQAIVDWLSKEFNRKITIADTDIKAI